MSFFESVLRILDTTMETPLPYGEFHLFALGLMVVTTVILAVFGRKHDFRRVRGTVLAVAIIVILFEIYKQINYSFTVDESGIKFDFQWYAFPWQFCSTPMYVGLLAGLTRKGKVHDAACAYLATFAVFAGLCVMVYPGDVFIPTIGINIQTMVCHGTMIVIGVYLLASGHVKLEHKTILKAIPVFVAVVTVAVIMNEVAHTTGLLETDTFNMFYISPYCDPHLPVYSLVQEAVAFPWCLVIYVVAFSLAAYLMLLIPMGIRKLALTAKKASSQKAPANIG